MPEMNAVVRCTSCPAERKAFGPEGQVTDELCAECEQKEFEAARERQLVEEAEALARAKQQRTAQLAADPHQALAAAGVPTAYTAFTRKTWEAEYRKPWPSRLVPRPSGKATPEWFISELALWPRGWTAESGWGQLHRHIDWGVMLFGDYGTRKTGLATSVAANAIARGALFPEDLRFIDMCVWIKQQKRDRFAHCDPIWWDAADAPMLIFDDVGSVLDAELEEIERGTRKGWWQYQVAELVRFRHMYAKPTIFTTNGSLAAFEAIHASLPSRLDVRLQWTLKGNDFRRKAAHAQEKD